MRKLVKLINHPKILLIKIINTLQKFFENRKILNINDKKNFLELYKHKLNFYDVKIKQRLKENKEKKGSNYKSIFTPYSELKNNFFYINLNKLAGYEGRYYYEKNSPFIETACQLIKNKSLKLEDSCLYNFFHNYQPRTYGELYNLSPSNKLFNLQSTKTFMPWLHGHITKEQKAGFFGPKHKTACHHRIIRLRNLINNIEKYGYIPSREDIIKGYILISENNNYRFVVTAGHHRIAVMIALSKLRKIDKKNIEVCFDEKRVNYKIMKEKDISSWPGIKSNFLSIKDSLEFFYSFFYGNKNEYNKK